MWLVLLFLLILFLGIIFSKISINIKNIRISDKKVDFQIKIKLYLFYFIKIISIKCNNLGIIIFGKTIPYKKFIKDVKFENIIKKDFRDLTLKKIKTMDLKIDNVNFTLKIGVKDVFITSFLVVFLSTYISTLLMKETKRINYRKIHYNILPEFNKYELVLEGNTTVSMKTRNLGIFFNTNEHNKKKLEKNIMRR